MMTGKASYSTISKILILQFFVLIFVTFGFFIIGTEHSIVSSVLGGLTAFLPNLYFAFRISLAKNKEPKKIVRSFYSGETGKFVMTFALFAMAFQVPGIQFLPLMVCFVAVLSVFWLALILFAHEFEI